MRTVQFILDEAALLGPMDAISDAVGIGRGYAVRLQLYYQSMGQLKRCFPEGQEHTLLSNTSQIFFGVSDNTTADYVSTRLGEHTIVVDSGGTSSGRSLSWTRGCHPSDGGGSSSNDNRNWQQQARRLLKPEEVIALPTRTAITFTPGVPPIRTRLLRYYEENHLGGQANWLRRSLRGGARLVRAATWCGILIAIAACVTYAAIKIPPGEFLRQ